MEKIIQLFILIPLLGFLITLVIHRFNEKLISFVSFTSLGISLALFSGFVLFWFFNGAPVLNQKEIVIFQTANYEFLLDFLLSRPLKIGTLLSLPESSRPIFF